jgi:hypothetical protein
LDIISLVFSCLFMVELLCSVWAFGLELRIPDDAPIAVTSPWAGNTDIHLPQVLQLKVSHFRRNSHPCWLCRRRSSARYHQRGRLSGRSRSTLARV